MKNKSVKKSGEKCDIHEYNNFHMKDGYVYACKTCIISKDTWNTVKQTIKKLDILNILF
jgi:hypothetical protein